MLTTLLLSVPPVLAPAEPQDPSATPPVIAIDGDEQRRYLLHAPPAGTATPRDGWKLLVVMPGGTGGVDFAPFVGNVRKHALDEEWLVAQIVAPVWTAEQAERLVWPTKRNPWPGMRFPCEELFADVLADVERKHALDPRYLLTLAWSSSGQLAYTLALQRESRVTGTFVAMSVYKPDELPNLKAAKGRRFHILHSPTDFIPIAMAEQARDELEKKKALVSYATYDGGHGWHGDVYGMLRAGLKWLEEQAGKAKPPRR